MKYAAINKILTHFIFLLRLKTNWKKLINHISKIVYQKQGFVLQILEQKYVLQYV